MNTIRRTARTTSQRQVFLDGLVFAGEEFGVGVVLRYGHSVVCRRNQRVFYLEVGVLSGGYHHRGGVGLGVGCGGCLGLNGKAVEVELNALIGCRRSRARAYVDAGVVEVELAAEGLVGRYFYLLYLAARRNGFLRREGHEREVGGGMGEREAVAAVGGIVGGGGDAAVAALADVRGVFGCGLGLRGGNGHLVFESVLARVAHFVACSGCAVFAGHQEFGLGRDGGVRLVEPLLYVVALALFELAVVVGDPYLVFGRPVEVEARAGVSAGGAGGVVGNGKRGESFQVGVGCRGVLPRVFTRAGCCEQHEQQGREV